MAGEVFQSAGESSCGELSKKKGSLLTLNTIKTVATETTASISLGSDLSYRQAPSSSSSLSCAGVNSPATLSASSLKSLFLRLDTKNVGNSAAQSPPIASAEGATSGLEKGDLLSRDVNIPCGASSSRVAINKRPHVSSSPVSARSHSWGDISPPCDILESSSSESGKGKSPVRSIYPSPSTVESCKLKDEYAQASFIPGRRGKVIGKGVTATIRRMHGKGSKKSQYYAVKEFHKNRDESKKDYEWRAKMEFSIAQRLNHPNIIESIRLCIYAGRWNHVMEYCSYGDLFTIVKQRYLPFDGYLCLFKQLCQGVAYLHHSGVAHCDIKLDNLLLSEKGHLKITDFGCSIVFRDPMEDECGDEQYKIPKCPPGVCGSLPYIAPEVLAEDRDFDPRLLDVWSCGIVCLAMIHNRTPWGAAETQDPAYARYIKWWEQSMQDSRPDGIVTGKEYPKDGRFFTGLRTRSLRRLVLLMLHPDPDRRIMMDEVMSDHWFKSIECCCTEPSKWSSCVSKFDGVAVSKVHNHRPPSKTDVYRLKFKRTIGFAF